MASLASLSDAMPMLRRGEAWTRATVWICGALLLAIYAAIFLPYFPTAAGTIGGDYGLFFPTLLTGYYWFLENGLFAVPWFSPSQCAGFPYFADPNVPYFSAPQFLVFVVSPLTAIRLTLLLFAAIGFAGTYLLMRHSFRSSRSAAVLAAALFMFNGFFVGRMLAGHLTFHTFTLAPLMMAMLLPGPERTHLPVASVVWRTCVAALCLAAMFQAGMVHGIPPVLLATVIVFLLHAMLFGWRRYPWVSLLCVGILALALSAAKLAAALALLGQFPRSLYPLPGVASIWELVWLALRAVFFTVPADVSQVLTNSPWQLDRHELDNSLTPVPLVLLLVFVLVAAIRLARGKRPAAAPALTFAGIVVLLIVPLMLNWYQPAWNAFLKSLPYFENSALLLRWLSAYVPVVAVASAPAFDRLPWPAARRWWTMPAAAAAAIGAMLFFHLTADRSDYDLTYSVASIEQAYAQARAGYAVPAIERIVTPEQAQLPSPGDAMIQGQSQAACYQPMMGYRLEQFPIGDLILGPVFLPGRATINLKNPACYLFPAENNCRPGDHFTLWDRDKADAFVHYRPFPFVMSTAQNFANGLNLAALLTVILVLAGAVTWRAVARYAPNLMRPA